VLKQILYFYVLLARIYEKLLLVFFYRETLSPNLRDIQPIKKNVHCTYVKGTSEVHNTNTNVNVTVYKVYKHMTTIS